MTKLLDPARLTRGGRARQGAAARRWRLLRAELAREARGVRRRCGGRGRPLWWDTPTRVYPLSVTATGRPSTSPAGLAAYAILATHRIDPGTGQCAACVVPGPCRPANVAANRLVELGLPLCEPAHQLTHQGKGLRQALAGLLARPTWVQRAPLLTYGWCLRLGLTTGGRRDGHTDHREPVHVHRPR